MANFIVESIASASRLERVLGSIRVPVGAVAPAVACIDLATQLAAMELASLFYTRTAFDNAAYLAFSLVVGITYLSCARAWGLYRYPRLLAPSSVASFVALSVALGVGVGLVLLFLLKIESTYSRGVLIGFTLLAPCLIYFVRLAIAKFLHRAIDTGFIGGRRVVLVGEKAELDRLSHDEIFDIGVTEVGRISLGLSPERDGLTESDRGAISQAILMARSRKASEYALVIPWTCDHGITQISEMLRSSPRAVRLYPDQNTRSIMSQRSNKNLDSFTYFELQPEPLSLTNRSIKRAFDIFAALVGLILSSPILAMAALLIKLDSPGPVFFRQTRRGFDDREFKIWKFRTMTVMEDGPNLVQAERNDKRVTRVGRVLRRASVDELPQLLNVLFGEMSIVGPRPHAVAHDRHYDDLIAQYALRRHVKPGLTGLAQVRGLRGETKTCEQMEMRVKNDIWYINNWSLWLDAKIAVRTVFVLAVNEAY